MRNCSVGWWVSEGSCCGCWFGEGGVLPLFRTARHSSSERESGCDMFADAEVELLLLKREPRNGMDGIDRIKSVFAVGGASVRCANGAYRAVALLRSVNVRMMEEKGGRRMERNLGICSLWLAGV